MGEGHKSSDNNDKVEVNQLVRGLMQLDCEITKNQKVGYVTISDYF